MVVDHRVGVFEVERVRIAERMSRIAPSATLALNAKAKELADAGQDVVSLTAGEPDFATPAHVIEAFRDAAARGETRYTPVPGIPSLRAAIAQRYTDLGIPVQPSETIVTTGGKQAIFNAALALLEPGDEVIIPAPYWLSYADIVRFTGATPVPISTTEADGFVISAESLEEALSAETKMLILNSPSNPTGAVISEEQMTGILDVLTSRPEIVLLFDEIYDKLVFPGARFVSPLELRPDFAPRTVITSGGSKAYAMTGLRMGWAVGPEPLIKAMSKLQGQSTSNATAPSQYALLAALEGDQAPVQEMLEAFTRRRDELMSELRGIDGMECFEPKGAFYAFPRITAYIGLKTPNGQTITSATDLADWLLEAEKLVVVPGEPFGSSDHVRLSFAVSDATIREALIRLKRALDSL